jgi:hypothetical protein
MTRKRIVALLGIAGIAVAVLAVTLGVHGKPGKPDDSGPGCSLAGSWMCVWDFPPGVQPLVVTETLTPMDPTGKRLVYWSAGVNPMYALVPWYPESDFGGDGVGTFVRTGPNSYDFTIVCHLGKSLGLDARGEVQYFWVFSGTALCTDENTMVKTGTLAFFNADQDDNPQDGLPDEGEGPFFCVSIQWVSNRVQVIPPYEATPMP